jgi:thiamine transporter ThiT
MTNDGAPAGLRPRGSVPAVVGFYGLVGPAIGGVVAWIVLAAEEGSMVGGFEPRFLLLVVIFSYYLGVWPALAIGLVMGLIAKVIRNVYLLCFLSTLAGGLIGWITPTVFAGGSRFAESGSAFFQMFAVCGAVAGFVCAAWGWRRRLFHGGVRYRPPDVPASTSPRDPSW